MNDISLKNVELFNKISNMDDSLKKFILNDKNIKKKIICDENDYPFIWIIKILSFKELNVFLDSYGIDLLVSSSNLFHKLNALVGLDFSVNSSIVCDERIVDKINYYYDDLYYCLCDLSIDFVKKYFEFLRIGNDFYKISVFKNFDLLLENKDYISIMMKDNLINFSNFNKFRSSSIEKLLKHKYYQEIVLNDDFCIDDLISKKICFDDNILKDKRFINKLIYEEDISKYRFLINNLKINNNLMFIDGIESKRNNCYDEYVNSYDSSYKMFLKYVNIFDDLVNNHKIIDKDKFFDLNLNYKLNSKFFSKVCHIVFGFDSNDSKINDLKKLFIEISNNEFLEILIDRYFKDVSVNFISDLKVINNFELSSLILKNDSKNIYSKILDIYEKKYVDINFYNSLNVNKNFEEIFYNDYKLLQKKSYDLLLNSLVKEENLTNQKNDLFSKKYLVDVYDFTGEEFYMLIHNTSISRNYGKLESVFKNDKNNFITSLSLISDNFINHYNSSYNSVILGFNNFNPLNIVHVYNNDSFSGKYLNDVVSKKVNKLYTPKALIDASSNYNEIVYQNFDENSNLIPNYVVVFDDISTFDVEVAKKFNIPIFRIDTTKYNFKNRNNVNSLNEKGEEYVFYDDYIRSR